MRGTETALEAVGPESLTLNGLGGHPETHPLGETYFSQVPFLYGAHIAKWQIAPVAAELQALRGFKADLHDKPDGLRSALDEHLAVHGGFWELRVQLCTDLDAMPAEDATVVWSEAKSPFVAVARIAVPAQPSWNDARSAEMDDGLTFSPWHGRAAHRPLGSIDRLRRAANEASVGARSVRGRCPVHED